MTASTRILASIAFVALPAQIHAQPARLSPADSARRANAAKILSPAKFALEKKTDLGLDAGQVSALQRLAVALDDSSAARRNRTVKQMQSRNGVITVTAKSAASWTGIVDEAGIKADFCQQSEYQADAMIGLVRDRHMVGAILTPPQRTQLEQIFAASVNPPQ